MRVNIYAEEMTDRIELVEKEADGRKFVGLRFYLYLPVTLPSESRVVDGCMGEQYVTLPARNKRGPFIHHENDDDSAAVTFWGKRDLRKVLEKAIALLDKHYEKVEGPNE